MQTKVQCDKVYCGHNIGQFCSLKKIHITIGGCDMYRNCKGCD